MKKRTILISICLLMLTLGTGAEEEKSYKLTLADVSRLALENNFEVQLAKYDAWIARTRENVAESIYDTIFDAEVSYRKNEQRSTSIGKLKLIWFSFSYVCPYFSHNR